MHAMTASHTFAADARAMAFRQIASRYFRGVYAQCANVCILAWMRLHITHPLPNRERKNGEKNTNLSSDQMLHASHRAHRARCKIGRWKKNIPKWMDRPNERTKKLFTPLEWDDVYDEEEEEEDGKRCFLFDFAIAAAAAAIALCSFTHTKISDFVCSDTVHHTLYACSTRSIHFSEFFFSAASSAFSVLRTE